MRSKLAPVASGALRSSTEAWLRGASFLPAVSGQGLSDLALSPAGVRELARALEERRALPAQVAALRERARRLADEPGLLVWAFGSLADIESLLRRRELPGWGEAGTPRDLWAWHESYLHQRFPLPPRGPVDILVTAGDVLSADPRIGGPLSAGSMATEVPQLLPRSRWPLFPTHSFIGGVFLVAVPPQAPLHRLDSATFLRLWQQAAQQQTTRYARRLASSPPPEEIALRALPLLAAHLG